MAYPISSSYVFQIMTNNAWPSLVLEEWQDTLATLHMQFECGRRILRVIHGRDARASLSNCITTATTSE
ncbi:MAG: hypothetical protein DMF74_22410 [Acidobacteria bacterium]|nr:MAG: hypothetical protein DMF74_22410 [Acidobacteriota bacterium]